MSRIGQSPISLPEGVNVDINGTLVKVSGKKGTLEFNAHENMEVQGQRLQLQLGFSHDIFFDMPDGVTITANRTEVKVEGIDKQLVGAVAAKIRSFRPPEPYKGKGIRYKDEYVRSKQGKTVGAK